MLTDTHCHLDLEAFDADRPVVIERALQAGLARLLLPGVNVESSRRCVQLAAENPAFYAAVGISPTEVEHRALDALDQVQHLATNPKVVAIGEIGLDYYWIHEDAQQARQRDFLQQQLLLARDLGRPVILHAREKGDAQQGPCFADMLTILERWVAQPAPGGAPSRPPGVLHSFSGSLEIARRLIELGFFIGVTGPITYKNASSRRDMIAALPLDRLLIETDAPYLAPVPHRGQRNEPAYVAHIADKIATIHARSTEEVITVTGANAARLFAWGETA